MNAKISIQTAGAFLQRHKLAAIFCAALGFGGFAAYGIKSHIGTFLETEREKLTPKVKTIEVVVAKRNLKVGDVVGPDSMAVRNIPEAFVSSHAVLPDRFDGFIGAKLGQQMQGGEALLTTAVAGADVSSFSAKVRPGIRALTIQVDEVNSVSGMLQPGDRIDLMVSLKPPVQQAPGVAMSSQPEITAPLLQDILVLATGRNVRPGSVDEQSQRGFNAITVEVTPENAQVLIVAQRGGKITALLRNPGDRNDLPKKALDIYALLGIRPPSVQLPLSQVPAVPVAAFAPQPQHGPEIIVGGRGALNRPMGVGAHAPVVRGQHAKSEDAQAIDVQASGSQGNGVASTPPTPTAPPATNTPGASGTAFQPKATTPSSPPGQPGTWPAHGLPQSLLEVR